MFAICVTKLQRACHVAQSRDYAAVSPLGLTGGCCYPLCVCQAALQLVVYNHTHGLASNTLNEITNHIASERGCSLNMDGWRVVLTRGGERRKTTCINE